MPNVPRKYFSSIINQDALGRRFWIYVNVPNEMLNSEITEEDLKRMDPEKCYLDNVSDWSEAAIEKLDMLLSLPDPDALTNEDRLEFEKSLSKL